MSGADFGDNSKIYNALWLVYHDLNNRIQKIINKWTERRAGKASYPQIFPELIARYAALAGTAGGLPV